MAVRGGNGGGEGSDVGGDGGGKGGGGEGGGEGGVGDSGGSEGEGWPLQSMRMMGKDIGLATSGVLKLV